MCPLLFGLNLTINEALKMAKEKIIYAETYKFCLINRDKLPVLPHLAEGFHIDGAKLMKAGTMELNGEKLEFQDIRFYILPDK